MAAVHLKKDVIELGDFFFLKLLLIFTLNTGYVFYV